MSKIKKQKVSRKAATGRWVSVTPHMRATKIIGALNNTKFHARTFEGVAKEVGARRQEIIETIRKDPVLRGKIKIYRRKASDGRFLVTTKERFSHEASIKDKFVDVFSTDGVKIEDV